MFKMNQKHKKTLQTKLWQKHLKEADVQIFIEKRKGQHPEPLDWESFSNALPTEERIWHLYFDLEWETTDMP